MSEFCSLCHAVEDRPYCPQHGVVHRPFVIGEHYELAQLIGVSVASFVFGGRDVRQDRPVAVRVQRAGGALDRDGQRREIDALALRAYDQIGDIVDLRWDDALGAGYVVVERQPFQGPDTMVQELLALDTQPTRPELDAFDVPAMVGSYRVVAPIGTGGHGRVYLGEHPVIGSKVAIKMLRPDIARSAETVERFIQEARASSQIASPHIPRYYDFGTTPAGVPYAIMEYFEGETLGSRLARGTMSVAETAQVVEQVASALAMAHDAGLIHRDLKPDNLFLVKPDGRRSGPVLVSSLARPGEPTIDVKVLDFGIAKMVGTRSATRTESGSFLGTPYYCAPEQVFGRPVDARTDVYSLGATAYEMLTGRPPFVGEVHEILSAKATEEAPQLRVTGVPPAVAQTVRKMLARDPAARAPSMTWVLAQLELWVSTSGELGRAETEASWDETRPTVSQAITELPAEVQLGERRTGSRRRVALAAVISVGALAIAGVATGVAWRARAQPRVVAPAARVVEPIVPTAVPSAAPGHAKAPIQAASPTLSAAPVAGAPAPDQAIEAKPASPGASRVGAGDGPSRKRVSPRPPRSASPRPPTLPAKRVESPAPPPRDGEAVMIVDPFAPAH